VQSTTATHTLALSSAGPCRTAHAQLLGAAGHSPALFTNVAQNYTVPHRPGAIDTRVAKHLAGAVPVISSCPSGHVRADKACRGDRFDLQNHCPSRK
jgi:hypothetical protein